MRIGFVSLPLTGHVNPMTALARKLQSRGDEVRFIGVPDIAPAVRAANLAFEPYCEEEYPVGSVEKRPENRVGRNSLPPDCTARPRRLPNSSSRGRSWNLEDLRNNRAVLKDAEPTALDELRMEFEDIRLRLHRTPEQFIVLSDLAVRSWRDPVVAKMFRKLDDGWHAHLTALLKRGIQQSIFRKNLNVPLCARTIIVALRGIGYQSRLPRRKVDEFLSELAAQTEHWITAEDAPQ
jgi:hypothetical protein